MKAIRLKKGSWHHKLATFGGMSRRDDATNLCEYTGHVMWGAFFASVVAVVCGFILYGTGVLLAAVAVLIQTGMWLPGYNSNTFTDTIVPVVGAGYLIALLFGIMAGASKLREKYRMWIGNKRWEAYRDGTEQRGFISLAWQSFREKTCVRIALDD